MSDRVLRPRARNRPSSVLLSEDMERVRFSSSLRRQKEVAVQNLLNTVAQDRFKSSEHKSFRKRVVFSKKRYTSDDLPNGLLPHAEHPPTATPVVGILKHSVAETEVAVEAVQTETTETPRPARRSRSRQARGPRGGRVSKHESFTEEVRTSPWKSAAESLLASLALSPLCRKRAQQAQVVASEEESVRRAVDFYRSSGEWWNVFPKTDFSYSPLSSFHHREISPGVRTLPNMSRSGLHSTNIYDAQFTPKRDPFSSDSEEETLAKPVHRTRGRNLAFREQESNALSSVLNVIQMSILTVLTFISSFVRSVYEHIYSSVTWKQKPTVIERPVRYHTQRRYRQNLLVHVWFQCREFFSKNYRRTFGVLAPSSSRILSILLVSLFIGLGWWFWNQAPGVLLNFKESVWSEIWTVISYPLMFIQSFVFHISNLIISVTNLLLSLISSADKITVILFDIITSPLKLLLSVLNLIFYLFETVLSLLHMIFSLILSFKVPFWETETDDSTQGVKTKVLMSQDVQEHVIRDIVDAALRQQEASLISKMYQNDESLHLLLLSKMAKFEESLRLELAAKDAKNSYLQDQLRRSLRRRFITCCRQPEPSAIRAEVWNHIHSPEVLVALGAALTESASIEMTGANVPLFNETEIRAWVSSAFLEKDDFDVKVANITKFLNDEVERRSRDSQLIWTTLRDLQSKLSDPYRNGLAAAGASPSSSAPFTTSHETLIHRIVDSALARYDADKTGMADYALESQGGQVVSTRCTETYQVKSPTLSVFGVPLWYPSNSPRTVIQPGMHPGECWAFVGSQGYLVIQLSHRIRVTGFTYEHISPVLLPTGKMDSAPKEFAVYGLRSEEDSRPFLLGDYHYLQNSTSMQHFSVQHAGVQPFQLIEIQVKSNHGNINYTCMYRFRVHGSLS